MTADRLYDFLISKMTPEEALKLLLNGAAMQYEKLKFDENEASVHPVFIISMAALDMGWQIAIENDQEDVRGMIVGTEEYLDAAYQNDYER